MPIVPQLVTRHRRQVDELPEEEPLYFPSGLAGSDLDVCSPGIAEIEERLREGQMHDALAQMRVLLHKKTGMMTFKDRNIRNQLATTWARSLLNANDDKIWALVSKYRKARAAKLAIAGHGDWEKKWRVLKDEDVRTIADDEGMPSEGDANHPEPSTSRKTTEGRRKSTWIWMSADGTQGGEGYDQCESIYVPRAELF